jgi:thiamine-phosphate pyrophosphorylase
MQKNPYKNVIAVTNRSLCQRPFAEQIERVCSLHPKAVILREKDLPEEEYSRLAEQILEICKRYQVPCIYLCKRSRKTASSIHSSANVSVGKI